MSARRLWSKDFIVALGVAVFFSFTFYLLITSMAGYAVDRFRAAETLAGFASSAFVVGGLAARLVAGPLLDMGSRYAVMLGSVGLAVLATLAYQVADAMWLLILVRFLHGVFFGIGHTGLMASVQDIIPPARRAEGTGYFSTSTTLAAALGPFLAITLVRDAGYPWLFAASTAVTLIGFIGLLFVRIPDNRPKQRLSLRLFHPRRVLDRSGISIGTTMLLGGAGYSAVMTYLADFAAEEGYANAGPLFFLAFALVSLVARLTVGRVQDRHGDNAVMYPLYACFVLSMLFITFSDAGWMLVVAGGLAGAGWGTLMSSAQAITINLAGPARTGVATSSHFLMQDIGFGLGPVILGTVLGKFGYQSMWAGATFAVVLSIIAYTLIHGREGRGPFRSGEVVPT
ncbi:MFS transporter [Brevibacterium samyangense]|uniref:MFS transporter n=1 Tax=Brevibacterium samyangense TaxID=366888 RepID=A0ABN2T4E1_9MICO